VVGRRRKVAGEENRVVVRVCAWRYEVLYEEVTVCAEPCSGATAVRVQCVHARGRATLCVALKRFFF